jgi:hypothetical protein
MPRRGDVSAATLNAARQTQCADQLRDFAGVRIGQDHLADETVKAPKRALKLTGRPLSPVHFA